LQGTTRGPKKQLLIYLPGLRRVRDARVLTQKELDSRSGVGFVTISRLERGFAARPTTAHRLAEALRVDMDDLLSEEGTGVPLGPLGSPIEEAKEQAAKLERREARGDDEGDAFWMGQWSAALQGVRNATKLLRLFDREVVRRHEALGVLERFIALERRAEERYFALHGWDLEEVFAEDQQEASQA